MKPEDSLHGRAQQPDAAAELSRIRSRLSSQDFNEPQSERDALAQVWAGEELKRTAFCWGRGIFNVLGGFRRQPEWAMHRVSYLK